MRLTDGRPLAFFYNLHLAEIFPLILGFIILAQSLSMVLIQSMALQTAFVTMCKTSATFVFTCKFCEVGRWAEVD